MANLSRSEAEAAIREKAARLIPVGSVDSEGDMVLDWVLCVTDRDVDRVIEQGGKFALRLSKTKREEISSFPLTRSDSIQLGMGYCVNVKCSVDIHPPNPK